MTLLAAYDRARSALAQALSTKDVGQVMASRRELDHVKLHAKQIQDRALLADATEFQLRAERHLGALLDAAEKAGELAGKGRPKTLAQTVGGAGPPATLKEIGVDPKLSATARRAAALETDAFEAIVAGARDKVRAGKGLLIDPVKAAAKEADIADRRAQHAARTKDGCKIEDLGKLALSGYRARFIGMDPQWKFLTRSEAGEGRSANVHYKTEEVDKIKNLPVGELAAEDSAIGMWMVDWAPQDALDLLAHYGFTHKTTLYTWMKTNGDDPNLNIWSPSTWHLGQGFWTRANPEDCWLATKGNPQRLYADVRQLIVAPVMEHSRKPDEWLERSERLCEGPYLELQARRTRPGWTSWGDELEWKGAAA